MNISEILINNGFEVYSIAFNNHKPEFTVYKNTKFNSLNNWFGVSLYVPDALFRKDNKEVILSLQGIAASFSHIPADKKEEVNTLLEAKACKYICLKIEDTILYESWSGVLPSEELIISFINQ